ncbi:MAG: DUF1211 domain-containing protein [Lactobacillaceae bacterium]|nr:DUF1211 domain-containing protein [Lactobacillaceae bacterium]
MITILVLEFKLPNYPKDHLQQTVMQQGPLFFSYCLTYVYIGILWLFHHDLFSQIKHTSVALNIMNLVGLFGVTLMNYVMTLMAASIQSGSTADMRFAFASYDLLALLISASYLWFYTYLWHHHELMKADCTLIKHKLQTIAKYPTISMCLYALAFILNFVNVYLGLVLLVAGIVFHGFSYWKTARVQTH